MLLLSAAERSGDLLAASVLHDLFATSPGLSVTGVAGPAMQSVAGPRLEALGHVDDLSGSGLVEYLPRLPRILRLRRRLQRSIEARPQAAVFVDGPDLHLPLLRRARALGVPAVQLVAPQFWAWRPARGRRLREDADLVLCLFRFEVERLSALGVPAEWVGHPVVERSASARAGRDGGSGTLALLPGSRPEERSRHVEPFVAAGREIARRRGLDLVLSWPSGVSAPSGVPTSAEPGIELLARADAALVAPGTATLEAAMVDCPTVVAGSLHPLTWVLARRLVQLESVALPNLLVGELRLPEVLQDLSAERLIGPLLEVTEDGARARAETLRVDLEREIGAAGFGARAASAIRRVAS